MSFLWLLVVYFQILVVTLLSIVSVFWLLTVSSFQVLVITLWSAVFFLWSLTVSFQVLVVTLLSIVLFHAWSRSIFRFLIVILGITSDQLRLVLAWLVRCGREVICDASVPVTTKDWCSKVGLTSWFRPIMALVPHWVRAALFLNVLLPTYRAVASSCTSWFCFS